MPLGPSPVKKRLIAELAELVSVAERIRRGDVVFLAGGASREKERWFCAAEYELVSGRVDIGTFVDGQYEAVAQTDPNSMPPGPKESLDSSQLRARPRPIRWVSITPIPARVSCVFRTVLRSMAWPRK
jgi:hypothetical protein